MVFMALRHNSIGVSALFALMCLDLGRKVTGSDNLVLVMCRWLIDYVKVECAWRKSTRSGLPTMAT